MKALLDKLSKYITDAIEIGRKPQYIVIYNGLPILIREDDLKSGINRTYIVSRDSRYLNIDSRLKSTEMLRAEAKLSATTIKEND